MSDTPVLRVCLVHPAASVPAYATEDAAGLDLSAALSAPVILVRGGTALVPTGLSIAVPRGYEAQVRPRSGLAMKHGVTILNAPGTIDADYRGEVRVLLVNLGSADYRIESGDRIAQLVVAPVSRMVVEQVTTLDTTARGEGGFGSTGR